MADVQGTSPVDPGAAPLTATEIAPSPQENVSVRGAANLLSEYRNTRDAPREDPAASPTDVASPTVQDAKDAEIESQQAEAQPSEQEAIEAPRSWSKEEKERFSQYPPETQRYLAQRENERDTALRRGQNEVAQARQALAQQFQQVQQMRQYYERALPQLQQALQASHSNQFQDIQNWNDVQKMAAEDPQRYVQWQASMSKQQAVQQQQQWAHQQAQQDYQNRWNNFAQTEDSKFAQAVPEISDPAVAQKVANQALGYLRDRGFSDDDLNRLWAGQASVSLRDSRIQQMLLDAARYRELKNSAPSKKAAVPPTKVLRPGAPAERASDEDASLSALDKQLDSSHNGLRGVRNAADLLIARRASRNR